MSLASGRECVTNKFTKVAIVPVRSGVLARYVSVGAAGLTIGVVPVTDTWIVKDIAIYNSAAAPQMVQLYLANPAFNIFRMLYAGTIPAASAVSVSDWVAAGPGDTINAVPGVAGVHFWVSGADLPGHL